MAAATLSLSVASPAFADTSQATAQAALVQLGTTPIATTGLVSATNDGTQANPGVVTGNTTPALSLLGTQTLLGVGALVQQAQADNNGTSAACAGVVGSGGLIQIGPAGDCTIGGANPSGGVTVNLAPLTVLTADAILAQCTANSDGTTTASATIVNGKVTVGGVTLLTLPVGTSANQGLDVPGVASLILNKQTTGTGSISATALDITLLGTVAHVALGTVTCGPNAVTPSTPTFPVKGLPIAAGTAAAAAVVALAVRRRRRATAAPAGEAL
ncbi:MAG: choice-of-anchor P family protein [Acidimicrobiales bacterium]